MTNDGIAREILDANSYVVLATADADGVPWASPEWFAREDVELYWVSHPGARHSQNFAVRPQIAMVVFDSRVVPGSGQGVYMAATAEQLTNLDALESGMAVVSCESVRDGAAEGGLDRVAAPARLRAVPCARDPIVDPRSGQPIRRACRCQAVTATPSAEIAHDRARGPEPDD